jgi:hypothetical protein
MPPTITQPARPRLVFAIAFACLACLQSAEAQRGDSTGGSGRDPFARRSWALELSAHAAFEAWNYNISREEMHGVVPALTYGVRDGLVLTAGGPLYYTDQRGIDAWMLGVTGGIRGRLFRAGRVTAFWEVEVGISEADTFTPPGGTRFNYLALGGAGSMVRIGRAIHLLAGVRWLHVSNNSLAGRARNPDIEAIGPRLGVVLGF